MKDISKKNSKGFTLLELIIVIAIIAILSAFFVSSLTAPNATRNARVEASLNQIPKVAELLKSRDSNYQNLSCSSAQPGVKPLCDDIIKNSADRTFKIVISLDGKAYCSVAKVYSNAGADEWRCISSNAEYEITASTTIISDCKAVNCTKCVCK
jgi:prepilin-type N-terminal cleavage/methylation domain-containing protein